MSTEGEIVARLKIDSSDWMAKLEEARTEANSLKDADPKITVTAKTGTAIAQLAAVAAITDRLGKAQDRVTIASKAYAAASAAAAAAEDRERRVRESATSSVDAKARALLALQRATTAVEIAQTRMQAAGRAFDTEVVRSAAHLDNEGQSLDRLGKSAGKAGNAAGNAAGPMAYLIGTAVALAPALVPIGAAAIGVTGALTGMGIAGGLAIAGISREMKAGKGPLLEYKGTLTTLQTALHSLEDVAGKALFPGVQASVAVLKTNMGEIQSIVATASKQLGSILPIALQGIVSMMRALQPAFQAGEKLISDLVKGFAQFAQSTSFKGFVDYIVKSMPVVEQFLGAVLNLAGRLLAALAPLGTALLRSLTPVLNALAKQMPAVGQALSSLIPLIPELTRVLIAVMPILGQLLQSFASLVTILTPVLIPALRGATTALEAVFNVMKPGVTNALNMAHAFGQFTAGVTPARIALEALEGRFGPVIQGFAQFGISVRQAIAAVTSIVGQLVGTVAKDFRAVTSALAVVQSGFRSAFAEIGRIVENGFLLVLGLFVLAERRIVATLAPFAKTIAGVVQSAMRQIEAVVGPALTMVESLFSRAWSSIASRTTSGANAVTSEFRSAFGTIDRVVASAISAVVSTISRGISMVVSAVSSGIGRAVSVFDSFRGRVLGAVSGFGSLLFSAGQNLIAGLINGAESMVGALIGSVEGIASNAISAAKSLLGIRSPSTVFHEIGRFLVQGFANGVASQTGLAHAAVQGLIPSQMPGISAAAVSSRSGMAVTPGWAYGSTQTVTRTIAPNITIVNPVAVDPVQQVTDAAQYVLAYSGLG